ncbi:MAG: phage holin family protein [Armatimonadetes bacterium]|jgi:hypothetical protein|nr:phage holin family protein [Armatimonadota bacterium]MDI9586758.1 hypothetical protein [Acidobacteriota bacterium]
MEENRTLGELLREFVAVLGEYLKQNAADAVDRALSEPLKKAARRVMFLGLALGFAFAAALMLALALFHLMVELFGVPSAAYAVSFVLCVLVGVLCARAVGSEKRKRDGKRSEGNSRGPEQPLDSDPAKAD